MRSAALVRQKLNVFCFFSSVELVLQNTVGLVVHAGV